MSAVELRFSCYEAAAEEASRPRAARYATHGEDVLPGTSQDGGAGGEEEPTTAAASPTGAPAEPRSFIEEVTFASGVAPPCDPEFNRALLQEINDLFDQDKQRAAMEKAQDANDVVGEAVGAVAAAEGAGVDVTGTVTRAGGQGGSGGWKCPPTAVGARLEAIRDGWQILALLLGSMTWPKRFVDTFGRFAGVLALDLGLVATLDFRYTFYLTGIPTLIASVGLAILLATDDAKDVKQLEAFLTKFRDRQVELLAAGKGTSKERTTGAKFAWIATIVLTTFYLPVTTYAIIAVTCHPSIMCAFDCYNEPDHKALFGFGILMLLLVSALAPLALFVFTLRKVREFHAFVGTVEDPVAEEELWELFARADPSPFALVYDSFTLRFAFFNSLTMVVKAALAVVVLAMEPNSTAQLLPTIVIEGLYAVIFAYATPFTMGLLNTLTLVSQFFVVLALSLSTLHRVKPDDLGPTSPSAG